jgi:hypothetical protein
VDLPHPAHRHISRGSRRGAAVDMTEMETSAPPIVVPDLRSLEARRHRDRHFDDRVKTAIESSTDLPRRWCFLLGGSHQEMCRARRADPGR